MSLGPVRRHPEGKQAGLGHLMGIYVSFWKRQRLWADAAPRVRSPASWEHLCAKRNVPLPQSRRSPPSRAPSFVSRVGENFSSHFPPVPAPSCSSHIPAAPMEDPSSTSPFLYRSRGGSIIVQIRKLRPGKVKLVVQVHTASQ